MNEIKSTGIAAVFSFFIPGLGQIYNGQIGKGIMYMIVAFFCALSTVLLIGFLLVPIWWIIGIVDAYKTANKINCDEPVGGFINLN